MKRMVVFFLNRFNIIIKRKKNRMSEYKCVKVINRFLTKEEFAKVYAQICKLEVGLMNEQEIVFSGKSEAKQIFSVDSGCFTTERNSFILALQYYLGSDCTKVEIL